MPSKKSKYPKPFKMEVFYGGVLHVTVNQEGFRIEKELPQDVEVESDTPQIWESETFTGLFDAEDNWGMTLEEEGGPNYEKLAKKLIDNDPRWEEFINSLASGPKLVLKLNSKSIPKSFVKCDAK